MSNSPNLFRAALPEILFVPDLASALELSETAVRRAIRRGELGPTCRIGRRIAIRRDALMDALEARETIPVPVGRAAREVPHGS